MSAHVAKKQRRSSRTWLYINIAIALALIISGGLTLLWVSQSSPGSSAGATEFSQQQGQPAPDFTLTSLEGRPVSLKDYQGQVVLINMWATWCPPCKAEMPALNAFYEAHQQEGFTVLAINSQEDARTVNAFIGDKGFSFPVLLDERAEVISLYQVRGLPTSFIIDRNGIVQHVQTGVITNRQLEKIVMPLLAKS